MNEHTQVVVGFDFSHSARTALIHAVALAAKEPWHVLQFVCVIDKHRPFPELPVKHVDAEYAERVQHEVATIVEKELQATNTSSVVQFFVHARIGKPAAEILTVARDVGADLILMGSRGATGIERFVLGSVCERVVRDAHCSVEVIRPKTYPDVALLTIVDHEAHLSYVPPHRYRYDETRVITRPDEWPLY